MNRLLTIFLLMLPMVSLAQWDVIHYGMEDFNDHDLFFQNADTGFVIRSNQYGGYVLRTHDGGAAWDSLWFNETQFQTIYMTSIDTGYIACYYQGSQSVMRTIDAGDSWQLIATDISGVMSIPYAISFFNNNEGIISVSNWAAKTSNAGVDWTIIEGFPGTRDNDISSTYFIGLDGAILVSSLDYGLTFNVEILDYSGSHYNLDLYDHRFISSAIGNNGAPLGFTVNSYGIITVGNILTHEYNIMLFPELNRVKGICWASEDVMYAVGTSIYGGMTDPKFFIKSIDGGETWFTQGTPEPGYWNTDKIDCPNDSVCYAIGGYMGRIYKTTNGGGPLLEEVQQIPLSVREIEDDINFSIAPNPTSGQVTLRSETEIIKEVKVLGNEELSFSVLITYPLLGKCPMGCDSLWWRIK